MAYRWINKLPIKEVAPDSQSAVDETVAQWGGFRVAAGVVFLGMRGLPLEKKGMSPVHQGQEVVVGDIISIGLGKRNAKTHVYPSMWAPIGGFIEDGETIKNGLIREVKEELGVMMGATLESNRKSLIPLWVEIDWMEEVVYYVYGFFYFFHLDSEEEVYSISNLAQIVPKHPHPKDVGMRGAASFRGLGTIVLNEEIAAFGNFGLKETWTALHSPTITATHADILVHPTTVKNKAPTLLPATTHSATISKSQFTPITQNIINGVANMNAEHYTNYTQNMNQLRKLLTSMAINYSLKRWYRPEGTTHNLPARIDDFDSGEAARHFHKTYTKRRNHDAAAWDGLGFLRGGSDRTQKSIQGRGMFDMAPADSRFDTTEILEWARKQDFPNQWWTTGLPSKDDEDHSVQYRRQSRESTPFLEFKHNRRAGQQYVVIPAEILKAANIAVLDELMSDNINQT